jgi:N-acetyl-anhydromuramyl-L-alanine amidase AmpD
MLSIKKIVDFKSEGSNKKKKQIVLANSSRKLENYITSLKERHVKKYKKIPNYIINKEGVIFELLSSNSYSNFFKKESLNKNSITIVFENLGWLQKLPLSTNYVNWIGDIYKGEIFERKWRDYFFWDPYLENQLKSCAELCNHLTEEFPINKKCVGHNTKVDGIENFNGIISRSNFDSKFTDLSPAFDFDLFLKYFENEQFV